MLIALIVLGSVPLIVPSATRWLGVRVFPLLAALPAAVLVYLVALAPQALSTGVEESVTWIPQLGMRLGVRLDALSWVLSLVVLGVGALVIYYCRYYFTDAEEGLGRFAASLLGFTAAMLGIVLADDVFLLYVFWEATSVLSYLLIGHYTGRRTSRWAALQALIVTTAGGLAMLVGLVLLAVQSGTASLTAIIQSASPGTLTTVAIVLVLVGALSKSAILPFHFWLPPAMAAPTPVSAYLHAAAMVQAGVYLVARLAPGFAGVPGWRWILVCLGVATMLLGGWRALVQHDLKLLLAHGTVSQLGFLVAMAGFGTAAAAAGAVALLLAHALYKAALFLVVGIIDHRAGTRDLRKLSGLGREAPVLTAVAVLAVASMAGLPFTLGFVAKEGALGSLLAEAGTGSPLGWIALVGVAAGSVLTVAYGARFLWGAFARKAGVDRVRPVHEHAGFLAAPGLLAVLGLVAAFAAGGIGELIGGYATTLPGAHAELALWHGLEPALGVSAATIAVGLGLFLIRDRVHAVQTALPPVVNSTELYAKNLRLLDRVAAATTGATQRGSLPFYLGVILIVMVGSVAATLLLNRSWPSELRIWDSPLQLALAAMMSAAALAAATAGKRFAAVLLVGATGYGLAAIFAFSGAPDLALTQVLVDTVMVIAFVLVLRLLPARLGQAHGTVHRGLRAAIGIGVGATFAVGALVALGARTQLPISLELPRLAVDGGHGTNVVNVLLVDIRGWDTLGELSVIIVAATGVASLIFLKTRTDTLPRSSTSRRGLRELLRPVVEVVAPVVQPVDSPSTRRSWLLAGRRLAPENRSILLEVMVRLLFHSIMLLSIYILLVGHNAVGGGFAGGLVAGLALVARYLAGGRYELGAAAPIGAGALLGSGLVLAAGTATIPLVFGVDALTSTWFEWSIPVLGKLQFVTSTVFDIGVYLIVLGLVLDVLRSLGAEVDRQQEEASDELEEGSTV